MAAKNGLTIDKDFAALIPPLAEEERSRLEENIKLEGCRDALVVWPHEGKKILLDGHNRLEICTRLKIPYKITEQKLASRAHARVWILFNQLGRRNLTEDQRAALALRAYQEYSALSYKSKAEHAAAVRWGAEEATGKTGKSIRTEIADKAGIPRRKMQEIVTLSIQAKSNPRAAEFLKKIERNEMTLADARREANQITLKAKLEDPMKLKEQKNAGRYDVLVFDPPWPKAFGSDEQQERFFTSMPSERIESKLAEVIKKHTLDDCHLFFWTTHKYLPAAFKMLEKQRVNYICTFVWQRPGGLQPIGLPLMNCEFAIYAQRGAPKFLTIENLRACFESKRGDAGEPVEFYKTLKRVTGGLRLDVFSRIDIDGFDGLIKAARSKKKAA